MESRKKELPDYDPPKELGEKSKANVWWNKSLSIYKKTSHTPEELKWVYMDVKTPLPTKGRPRDGLARRFAIVN